MEMTTIDALFSFIAHHRAGAGAVGFTLVVLAAVPLFRFRAPWRPAGVWPWR